MQSMGDKFSTAVLRVSSQTISASEIEHLLRLKASRIVEKEMAHTLKVGESLRDESRWILESSLSDSETIEKHIDYLLKIVEENYASFQMLPNGCEADIWCTISSESEFVGFCLDRSLMERAAKLALELIFSVYACSPE